MWGSCSAVLVLCPMGRSRPSTADLKKKAEGWLNSEGFPLEMKVARALRQSGFLAVYQGLHYRDKTEQKWREVDVSTLDVLDSGWKGTRFSVRCVIECMYSAFDPWIVLPVSEEGDFDYSLTWRAQAWSPAAQFMDEAIEQDVREPEELEPPSLLDFHDPVAYGVVRTQKASDTEEGKKEGPSANVKVSQLLSAVGAMARTTGNHAWELFVPVMVLDGELFSTKLGPDGQAKIIETKGEATLVVDRYDIDEPPVAVRIVTLPALPRFCSRIRTGLTEFKPRLAHLMQTATQIANETVITDLQS